MYAYLLYIELTSMYTLYKWLPSRMSALFPGRDLARVLSYSKYRGEGPTIRARPARGGTSPNPMFPL